MKSRKINHTNHKTVNKKALMEPYLVNYWKAQTVHTISEKLIIAYVKVIVQRKLAEKALKLKDQLQLNNFPDSWVTIRLH